MDANIFAMNRSVTGLPRGKRSDQRLELPAEPVPRRPGENRGGRAWINGREVGGTPERYAHLGAGHD